MTLHENANIKKGVAALFRSYYFPIALFAVAVIAVHCIVPIKAGDDAYFSTVLAGEGANFSTLLDFLDTRYHYWASRIGIEAVLVVLARFPILWRISDALICIGTLLLISSLYNPEKDAKKQWLLLLGAACFPAWILFETGSIATTLNYLWPFAAALLTVTPCIKRFLDRDVKKWELAVGILGLLFAGFSEILCAILILFFFGSAAVRIVSKKQVPTYELVCSVIGAAMVIFALTCPGNHARLESEILTWFPTYPELSLFNRVELGFSSMMKSMFLMPSLLVPALCLALLLLAIKKRNALACSASAIPLLFSLVFGNLGALFPNAPVLSHVRGWVTMTGIGVRLDAPATWLILLIFVGLLVCILTAIYQTVEDKKLFFAFFFLLALGAASKMALGLSPTVWASGERTCTYLYAVMAAVLVYALERFFSKKEKT